MSFERDVAALFGRKAEDLTEDHTKMLRRLWECGRREGIQKAREETQSLFDGEDVPAYPPDFAAQFRAFWALRREEGRRDAHAEVRRLFESGIDPAKLPQLPDGYSPELAALVQSFWQKVLAGMCADVRKAFHAAERPPEKPKRWRRKKQPDLRLDHLDADIAETMRRFWTACLEEGVARGHGRLTVIFTEVIRNLSVHEVFDVDGVTDNSINGKLKGWVLAAWTAVLAAEDLDEAMQVARRHRAAHDRDRQLVMSHHAMGFGP